MDNNFNINSYFTTNYNLGNKPTVSKFNFKLKKKFILLIIAGIAMLFIPQTVFKILGVIMALGVAGLFIVMPITKEKIKISNEKKNADEWQKNYSIRRNTWDAEFDKYYAKRVDEINPRESGMRKIGIDEVDLKEGHKENADYVATPFYIYGGKHDNYYRVGYDGKLRADHNEITWFFFSDKQIYIYTLSFKLTDKLHKIENTMEFFYSDIVSISTESVSVDLSKGKAIDSYGASNIESEEFKLVVPGDKMNFAFTTTNEISRTIQAMKSLIRTKKNG